MKPAVLLFLAAASLTAEGLNDLGAFLGVWHTQGDSKATPYSTLGTDTAETNCAWSANHGYLVCDQTVHTAAGQSMNNLSIYTYNEKDRTYAFFGLSRDDASARTPKLTIEGRRWTYTGGFDNNGKHTTFRTINDFTSPKLVTYRAEYSEDGEHWTLMSEGKNVRVK